MDLNKHVVKNVDDSFIHSNGIANIANQNRIGSVSTSSFNQRLQIESKRNLVGSYKRSTLGSSYGALRAKQYRPDNKPLSISSNKSGDSLQRHNSTQGGVAQHHFSDKPIRKI